MHGVMVAFESSTAVHLLKETSIISLTVHPSSKIDCNSNRYLYISVPVFHLFFNHSNRLVLVKSTIFFDICLINPIWLLKLLWAIFFQDNYSTFCQKGFLICSNAFQFTKNTQRDNFDWNTSNVSNRKFFFIENDCASVRNKLPSDIVYIYHAIEPLL